MNDYCGALPTESVARLERLLTEYERATSTQIVVLVVPDFQGYDANGFAVQVGQEWGVGQRGKDNGVVVLLRPGSMPAWTPSPRVGEAYDAYSDGYFDAARGTVGASILSGAGFPRNGAGVVDSALNGLLGEFISEFRVSAAETRRPSGDYGEAYIATGYGMEGYLTDLQSASICRNLMAPLAVMHRYDDAVEVACIAIMEAARGVYVADAAEADAGVGEGGLFVFMASMLALVLFLPCLLVAFIASIVHYRSDRSMRPAGRRGSAVGQVVRMTGVRFFRYLGAILSFFFRASVVSSALGGHGTGFPRGVSFGGGGFSGGGFTGGFSGGGGSFGGGGGGARF